MELQSPAEIWQHPAQKIRDFGKGLGLLGLCLGLIRSAHHLGTRTVVSHILHARFSPIWEISCKFWIGGLVAAILFNAFPGLVRPIYVVVTTVGMTIGFIISRILLTLTYMTLFVVIGRWRRSSSPINKSFDTGSNSYWKKHARDGRPARYYRQF
jgi:hypothetical protein